MSSISQSQSEDKSQHEEVQMSVIVFGHCDIDNDGHEKEGATDSVDSNVEKSCCKNFSWRHLELISIISAAVIVCGLLTLPTVFYFLPSPSLVSIYTNHGY